jgi:hypothetical protein
MIADTNRTALVALAATPTFAALALLSASGGGMPDMLCSDRLGSPLGSMTVMYALMGVFHAAPWLRMIARRRRRSFP